MKSLALVLLALACPLGAQATCGAPVPDLVVSRAWVMAHSGQPGLLVLKIGPGAADLNYAEITPPTPKLGLTVELPQIDAFFHMLDKLGVRQASRIVLYGGPGVMFIQLARAWATFDAFGLGDRVSILSGHASLDLLRSPAAGPRLRLAACPAALATLDYVRSHAGRPGTILIDAHLPRFYSGQAVESPGERAGHIPQAVNLPFRRLLRAGRQRPIAELREAFQRAGIAPRDEIIVYCHSGQKAAVVYLAARLLGFRVRLFDGSWQAWSRDRALPAALGP